MYLTCSLWWWKSWASLLNDEEETEVQAAQLAGNRAQCSEVQGVWSVPLHTSRLSSTSVSTVRYPSTNLFPALTLTAPLR